MDGESGADGRGRALLDGDRSLMDAVEHSCEVLIVGGGPSGLVLACLLANHGVDVAVLERRAHPRSFSRAIGLHPPALAVLKQLGLDAAACAEGVQVHSGTAWSRGRRLGTVSFDEAWPERPFVLTLPQSRTEALLTECLHRLAPESLQLGWTAAALSEGRGGQVRVVAQRSAAPTETAVWRAKIVVGADGPRSVVRASLGISTRLRRLPDTYLMGDFHDDEALAERPASLYLEPAGIVESFPLPGGTRRWVAHTGTSPAEESPGLLGEIIRQRLGFAPDPETATMISAFGVRRRLAERMVRGRSVIIGDAAHEVSPIGGQGMTLGWLDAAALAPLLLVALADGVTGPLEALAPFRAFEQERLHAARTAARQAELNMLLGRPRGASAAAVRNLLIRILLATPARGHLARAFSMRRPLPLLSQVPQKVR